jgi:cobalt-zinc-cadmium resistance protein CzcA
MVENAYRHLNTIGRSGLLSPTIKAQIIIASAKEVATPVTFAILIIVAVFIPLLSLDGLAGKLYSPMALNIVFVMLGSLLVALVLVPVLSLLLLKPKKQQDNIVMRLIKWLYLPSLKAVLRFPKITLLTVAIGFFYTAYLLTLQGREFMPTLNEESIMYRVIAPPSTALSQSVETAQAIERHILKNYSADVKSVLSMIGRSEKGETAQPNYMEVLLTLKPNIQNLPKLSSDMTKDLSHTFEHVRFVPTQPIAMRIEELLEGVQSELAIKIYGEDQKAMTQISKDIQKALEGLDGLEEIEIEPQLGQANIIITPNYQALARYGIRVDEIMQLVRNGIGEEPITQKIEGVKRFRVVAKIRGAKEDIESLKNITIRSNSGVIVSLDEVCNVTVKQGASFIKRQNLNRYMVLGIETKGRDVASLVSEANQRIKEGVNLPSGYYIEWAGDFKNMQEATERLMMIIPITILLILLLLYTAFNSIKKALLVLMNVPFGLAFGFACRVFLGL